MNKYIAFMDLLGTKALAVSARKKYRELIEDFHETVNTLRKKFGKNCLEINVFSDCAYFESDDILKLSFFFQELRKRLLLKKICFNAAICEGELGTDGKQGKNFSIVDFKSEDVVKVYGLQSCFSGAGIFIDPALLENKEVKEDLSSITVQSIYKSISKNDGSTKINSCIDLKLGTKSIELLIYILNLYISCHISDKRAARYYFTLYATFLNEQCIDVFLENDMKIIKKIMEMVKKINLQDDKDIFVIYLINRLYDAQRISLKSTREDIDDSYDNIENALNYIYKEAKLDNLCNLKEIDEKILSNRNKALFSEYCFKRKIMM